MNLTFHSWIFILTLTLLTITQIGLGQRAAKETNVDVVPLPTGLAANQTALALFERIKAIDAKLAKVNSKKNATTDEDDDDDEEEAADEEEQVDKDENDVSAGEADKDDEDEDDNDLDVVSVDKNDGSKIVSDIFGNQLKLGPNRTLLIKQNKARDLGLIAIKTIILGPLIGLTFKAALIRGLIWAIFAYGSHLFLPGLLNMFGLGTGLVGFARQSRPSLAQIFLPTLAYIPSNLHSSLPSSFRSLSRQYRQMFLPIVDSIRSIPEGHCRFRAVCETASQLIRNSQFMSSTLQRLSATVYLNFGTDYSKAWLDGIVQSDCAVKYSQCPDSPLSMVANKLAETAT